MNERQGPSIPAGTQRAAAGRAGMIEAICAAAPAEAGALVAPGPGEPPRIVALCPPPRPGQSAPAWLAQALETLDPPASSDAPRVYAVENAAPFYGGQHSSLIVVRCRDDTPELALFLVRARGEELPLLAARLSIMARLLAPEGDPARNRAHPAVLRAVAALDEHARLDAAGAALCNEAAALWGCRRVTLGVARGGVCAAVQMSHTARINRRSRLVEDIEAAMDECLDQDTEVVLPEPAGEAVISRAARELADRHGTTALCALPLRAKGEAYGVLLLERDDAAPFTPEEVESLRLLCEVIGGRVRLLDRYGRGFPRRLLADAGDGVRALLGPRHTWLKLGALATLAAAAFLTFAHGTHNATGTFRIEATEKRIVPAPYDGYLIEAAASPGDAVGEGDLLARLDDASLRLQLGESRAEHTRHQKAAALARRERREAEAQMADAEADRAAARIAFLEHQIRRSALVSPIGGVVLSGDLRQRIGSPVRTGDRLFEVAPHGSLHADVFVPESEAPSIRPGLRGTLAPASAPGRRVGFTVDRIAPVGEAVSGRTLFRVRARLDDAPEWMRPGMEGLARIDLGPRRYAWLWTHRITDWLRLRLWL